MAETWKHSGLLWRGTWRRAETEYLVCVLMVRFSSRDCWTGIVGARTVGTSATREGAMKLAKSRVPRPDRCPCCGQKIKAKRERT